MGSTQFDIGAMRVVRIRAARRRARPSPLQSPQWSTPPGDARVCIAVQLEGRCTVEQADHRFRLGPQSWAMWDYAQPASLSPEAACDQVALLVPRSRLGGAPLDASLPFSLSGCTGPGRLVLQAARTLADEAPRLAPADAEGLSDVTLRLVRLALAPQRVLRDASAASLWEK